MLQIIHIKNILAKLIAKTCKVSNKLYLPNSIVTLFFIIL